MTTLTLQIPDSVVKRARALALKDGISLDQFVALAMAEQTFSRITLDEMAERAKRGSREKLLAVARQGAACRASTGGPMASRSGLPRDFVIP